MIWLFPATAFSRNEGNVMAKQAKLLNQLWVDSGASYTFNVCTTAATDPVKGWQSLVELYEYLLGLADHRVATWPLMSSPWPTVFITLTYLYLVSVGPKFMANRKPLELKPLLLLYNASVAGLNLYIGLELTLTSQQLDFSWTCEPVDYTLNPLALRVASALWYEHFLPMTFDDTSCYLVYLCLYFQVVLCFQSFGNVRHSILYLAQEGKTVDLSSCLPSQYDVWPLVDRC